MKKIKQISAWLFALLITWLVEKILDKVGLFDLLLKIIDENPSNTLWNWLNVQYAVWQILIAIAVFGISLKAMQLLLKSRKKDKISFQENIIQKQKSTFKKDHEFILVEDNILGVKADIHFNQDESFGVTIEPYCLKHGTPMKMIHDLYAVECPVGNCENRIRNSRIENNLQRLQTIIHSELEQKWKVFKSKPY